MSEKISFAHNLRGIAAFSVVLAHLAGVFWLSSPVAAQLANTPAYIGSIPKVVKYVNYTSYGHFGVALFFLISGFVIPFSLKKLGSLQFLIARFFRLWPLYAVGLSITLSCIWYASMHYGFPFNHTVTDIMKNILLVRDLFWIPSIDGIVWTLEIEVKYYLICALIAPWIRRCDYKNILILCFMIMQEPYYFCNAIL